MFKTLLRKRRVTHPAPEVLLPFALGEGDGATAAHVATCSSCRAEVDTMRESTGLLRSSTLLERRMETPECPDELVLADFVDGRLGPEARAPVVAHLLACARCRATVRATADLVARADVSAEPGEKPRPRWVLPLGIAAAAAVLLFILPSPFSERSEPTLREPPLTNSVAPRPILPRGSVPRLEQLVWSSVPHAARYRVRLYDAQGNVVWLVDMKDTVATPPPTVALSPGGYFWRVEAETEWRRWAASDLIAFRITESGR
jgi:hypothetical protein